jgi:Uma2 family endonuclease
MFTTHILPARATAREDTPTRSWGYGERGGTRTLETVMTAALHDGPPTAGPPAGGWTADDLDALPEDGLRRELLDGVLLAAPTPSNFHQVIAMRLGVALEETCPGHYYVTQSVSVVLSPRRVFIPDVLVTTDEASRRSTNSYRADEVVLAVVIVSPNSQSMDRVMKPALYAKAGIPFYWLIETDGGLKVHTYKLEFEGEVYQPSGTFDKAINLDGPWRIDIPLARLRPRHL